MTPTKVLTPQVAMTAAAMMVPVLARARRPQRQ
jgi:hypothetical protein